MTDKVTFNVATRDLKTKTSKVRQMGKTPANLYGLNKDSQQISIDTNAFIKLYNKQGDTGLFYLEIDGTKEQPALVDEVSYGPVSKTLLHVAFKRVNLMVKVTAPVPVVLVGENTIPETVVSLVKDEIEVEALPANLPKKFEVDISTLTEVDQMITLNDLSYDRSKVELVLDEDVDPASEVVVVLQAVKEEVVEVAPAPEDAAADSTTETATNTNEKSDSSEEKTE